MATTPFVLQDTQQVSYQLNAVDAGEKVASGAHMRFSFTGSNRAANYKER